MRIFAIVFSFSFLSTAVLANDVTIEADLLFAEYFFGQNVSVGLVIVNSSEQGRKAVITATSTLDPDYLRRPSSGQRSGDQDLIWNEEVILEEGDVITRVIHPFDYGWNKQADYNCQSIGFSTRVLVDIDGEVFERLVDVAVNRPTSEAGLELWNRFLKDEGFHYHYISASTLVDLVPEFDPDEPSGSAAWLLSCEYSEGFAAESLARMSYSGWLSLATADDQVDFRELFQSKRNKIGTERTYGIHPAECLAIALSERTKRDSTSTTSAEVEDCTRSNRYYSALAEALVDAIQ